MKKLSKEAEETLLQAVGEVAERVAGGESPNDAVTKVASERQLPAGHVRLVVNAFNTGRTNAHRKSADDVWGRAGEFELADAAEVLGRVYQTEKAAAAPGLGDYSRPPAWVKRRPLSAAQLPPLTEKKAAAERAPSDRIDAAPQKLAQSLEERRGKAQTWHDRVCQSTDWLRDYFRSPGCLPFAGVRKLAAAKFGPDAEALFDHLAKTNPAFLKQAGAAGKASGEPFEIVECCLVAARGLRASRENYQFAAEKSAAAKAPAKKAAKPEHVLGVPGWSEPAEKAATVPAEGGEDLGVLRPFLEKSAFLGGALSKIMNIGPIPAAPPPPVPAPPPPPVRPEMLAWELSSPEHDNDLRSVQVNSWLQDMMANDQVVGQHHPDQVAQAYNDLAKVAPRAMGNPMVAKMMMSTYLSQGGRVGLFDAQGGLAQLLEVENKIKQRDAYPAHQDPFSAPEMPDSTKF